MDVGEGGAYAIVERIALSDAVDYLYSEPFGGDRWRSDEERRLLSGGDSLECCLLRN